MMLRWYLVHTKPAREAMAQENLERQNFRVYFPRIRKPIRWGARWKVRISALFPRYLFLQLHEGRQSLAPVHSTLGVANVVRFGVHYTIVPEGVIAQLHNRADPESGLHELVGPPALEPGSRVRIAAGPCEGFEGIFQRQSGADRVVVLLNLLGRDAPVCVPTQFIQASVGA